MKEIGKGTVDVATGGEPAIALMSTIVEKGMKYFDNKRTERLKNFYEELYQGTVEEERLKYERQIEVNTDDFYGLLNAAIEDEEKQKVSIYVNLFKAIRDKPERFKGKKIKYQAIKIAKDLPYSALEIIKNTFKNGIKCNHKKSVQGKPAFQIATENHLNKINTASLRFELNILEQYTMIYKDSQTNMLKLNPLAVTFVKSYFSKEELTV